MVAALERHDLLAAANAAIAPILQRHFQRDLHGNRAGFAKEHPIEAMRTEHAGQPAGQRQSLFVYEAAEHHMRHGRELALNGRADMRMIVAVARGPPRRDAVDQFASISQHDPAALRRGDGKRKRAVFICA